MTNLYFLQPFTHGFGCFIAGVIISLEKEEDMCQHLEMRDKTCGIVGGVEVDLIDCADMELCTSSGYEKCPVYFVSFFPQDRSVLRT